MNIFRKIAGPRSKYLTFLPYTYEARVDVLYGHGDEPLYLYYNADTLCGLIECLQEKDIGADEVEIFEIYVSGNLRIKNEVCLDKKHHWLKRPHLCKALKGNYIGHSDEDNCAYQDRDRQACGPY